MQFKLIRVAHIPDDERFEGKTDKQKTEMIRKVFMSVGNSGCLKVDKVKVTFK